MNNVAKSLIVFSLSSACLSAQAGFVFDESKRFVEEVVEASSEKSTLREIGVVAGDFSKDIKGIASNLLGTIAGGASYFSGLLTGSLTLEKDKVFSNEFYDWMVSFNGLTTNTFNLMSEPVVGAVKIGAAAVVDAGTLAKKAAKFAAKHPFSTATGVALVGYGAYNGYFAPVSSFYNQGVKELSTLARTHLPAAVQNYNYEGLAYDLAARTGAKWFGWEFAQMVVPMTWHTPLQKLEWSVRNETGKHMIRVLMSELFGFQGGNTEFWIDDVADTLSGSATLWQEDNSRFYANIFAMVYGKVMLQAFLWNWSPLDRDGGLWKQVKPYVFKAPELKSSWDFGPYSPF